MNLYAHNLSLLDSSSLSFFDPSSFTDDFSRHRSSSSLFYNPYDYDDEEEDDDGFDRNRVSVSPPKQHRHDGKSPLPLGMDWSAPPRKWDGRATIWPHDPKTGWSYCAVVPSWTIMTESQGSDPVVFYKVQVGIQSPEGVTTIRCILKRFSDFLKLSSELKNEFPKKRFPQAPPKKILRMKNKELLEERRSTLEDWMDKLLSDIDISRSIPVATFLELEASVRSHFNDEEQQTSDTNSFFPGGNDVSSFLVRTNSNASINATSSVASDHAIYSPDEISEVGARNFVELNPGTPVTEQTLIDLEETNPKSGMLNKNYIMENLENSTTPNRQKIDLLADVEYQRLDGQTSRFMDPSAERDIQNSRDLLVALPSDERYKLNRVLTIAQQRLATAKGDMEDLIARLNQEVAVRQFLTAKVKDLEVELETTKESCKETEEQTVLSGKEKFTQMQWDMEELRNRCLEMELSSKSLQDEKVRIESAKATLLQDNKKLLQELSVSRDRLENMQRQHEELEMKSKADMKVLVKEVKMLRSSQSDLKQECSRLMKEKIEMERALQKEKQRSELANSANAKLLQECKILWSRLQECSVDFLIEEEDKLIVDTSSPSDAIDLLVTSDNRIGLLLAEAQLLAQDLENVLATVNSDDRRSDDELRKMVTDILVDNARLQKQVNSVLRCTLNAHVKSDNEDEEEEETTLRKTVLGKLFER